MKLEETGGVWLSAKNCKDGEVVEFLNEGVWKDSTRFTYDDGNPVRQLIFKVNHNNEEKQLTLIKPSRVAMVEAFGDDTIAWVNKKATILLALNTKGGKSIMLEPIGKTEAPAAEKEIDLEKELGGEEPEPELPF